MVRMEAVENQRCQGFMGQIQELNLHSCTMYKLLNVEIQHNLSGDCNDSNFVIYLLLILDSMKYNTDANMIK